MSVKSMLKNSMTSLVAGAALIAVTTTAQAEDIVDIAVEAKIFNSLILAAAAGGLADDLKGEGPFTVYAPTDEAFAALPEGTVETLFKPENRDQLVAILTYHVDDRRMLSSAIGTKRIPIKPLNTSSRLCMNWNKDGTLVIGDSTGVDANVIQADIVADNGIIHVVDKVLMPGNRRC